MERIEKTLQVTLLVVFVFFAQFYKLGDVAYMPWDESRLITSAYEMQQTGDLIVTTIGYQPDLVSNKPPFLIWMQAACIKIGGLSEFTARLPSAVAAGFTALILFIFLQYVTKSGWLALLSVIVISTAKGFHKHHASRYADYDAMLTFFCLAAMLSIFLYTQVSQSKKNSYLYLFFLSLTLGFLTKGVSILMFTPGIFMFLLIQKQVIPLFKNKHTYFGALGFILVSGGYLLLREHYNPGYMHALNENEILGRVNKTIDGHQHPFSFYFMNIRGDSFGNWYWALPLFLVVSFFNPSMQLKKLSLFIILCFSFYLLIISSSLTKVFWYDMPLYPLLAMAVALTVGQLASVINVMIPFVRKKVAIILLIVIFSIQPATEIYPYIAIQKSDDYDCYTNYFHISYYFRSAHSLHKDLNNVLFLSKGNDLHWKLYVCQLNDRYNYNMRYQGLYGDVTFVKSDRIIAQEWHTQNYIESNYTVRIIEEDKNIRLYEVIGAKDKIAK